ncbi:hypothetical protein DRI50_07190 [candidate division KSB1 bacterium]|nr:MAG: hypothetical protein DRI50_07190 [candidate division KSB1 bacterium]
MVVSFSILATTISSVKLKTQSEFLDAQGISAGQKIDEIHRINIVKMVSIYYIVTVITVMAITVMTSTIIFCKELL